MNKKAIYESYGIKYENGKIYNPVFGWISPMLINGNAKLGKGVWTFSTLPSNKPFEIDVNGEKMVIQGTCVCNCVGCYAQTGFYKMPSTLKALAIRTAIARLDLRWLVIAIIAQIHADDIKLVRIHASGDFFSFEYINAWREIVKACGTCVFWTYTKNASAENAFTDYSESVYKHVDSNRETMLSDLAAFVLSHSAEDDALMYKRTTYHGNVKRERYAFDENIAVSWSEFIVETEYYYDRTKVTWWDASGLTKKYYTEKKGA